MTPAMLQHAGIDGSVPMTRRRSHRSARRSAARTQLRAMSLAEHKQMRARRARAPASSSEAPGALRRSPASPTCSSEVRKFTPTTAAKGDAAGARRRAMRELHPPRAQYAVIAHEMGHSVGLRHNFVQLLRRVPLPPAVLAAPHRQRHRSQTACTDAVAGRLDLRRPPLLRPGHRRGAVDD